MGAFKKIQVELIFLFVITFSLFISFNLDLSFYIYFKNFNENPNNIYLKNFFVEITRLGNSSWYFTLSIIGFGIFYLNNKFKIIQVSETKKISNFFISSILYILAVGIITQAGKHIMGRPRPNYTDFENSVVFKFFTLESNFHSFPSGHSSTIFIVCLIISSVFPKLKYYFYFLGSIVALSRVVVGAHFFTDIVAGALIALITFKLLNVLLEKKYAYYKFTNLVFINRSHFFYYILFLIISCLFVSAGPSLDLFISELFYFGKSQFMLQSYDLLSIFKRYFFTINTCLYSDFTVCWNVR